jgi:hypothetical protein
MITILNDIPSSVAGFRLNGKVTGQDYETIVIPKVDAVAEETGKVRFLLILETSIGNFNIKAIWEDLKVGLKHLSQWHKTAIVSDEKGVNVFTDTLGQLLPGPVKSFTLAEQEEAKRWIAEDQV